MAVQDVQNPIVHKVSLNPGNETRKAKTRLDEIFEEREERAAKRYSAAELEKMAIESENEAARLRGEPPPHKYHGGNDMDDDDEKRKQEEKQIQQREKITTQAIALINSGMEPAQVGQMLMGLSLPGTTPMAPQGMNFKDVMEMVTFMVGRKDADDLKDIITRLDKKVDNMEKNPPHRDEQKPVDPITLAKQQAEVVVAWNKALKELMPPPSPVHEGEPLDIIKERHRHDEKMTEIKNEMDFKHGLVDVAADIPERIGHGWAERTISRKTHEDIDDELPYMMCTADGCKTKIYYSPNANKVECPRCGAIYAKNKVDEVEVKE